MYLTTHRPARGPPCDRWMCYGLGWISLPDKEPANTPSAPCAGKCEFGKIWKKALTGVHPPKTFRLPLVAGWSSLVARQAHNLKVAGSNPAPAPNLKPPESLPGVSCLTAYAIFERATVRVQPQSTRGNFGTPKPNITPNIFSSRKAGFPHRPSGSAPTGLTLEHQ